MKQRAFLELLTGLHRRFKGAARSESFRWSAATLKDLGLSRSDLPVIDAGRYATDTTRRQR